MAVLVQNKSYTLAEANKAAGNVETGNLLADFQQRNAFLDEVPWFPTTHGSHTEELRAKYLEGGEFTEVNAGIPTIGGTADILKTSVKIYEGESEVSDKLLQFADDPYKARDSYDTMNLEGIMQDFNKRILYAKNPGDDKAFKALTERKNLVDPKNFVFSAGGSGTGLTSAWLFEFGKKGFHFIYGKHTSPGLSNTDKGILNRPAPDGKGFHDVWVRQYSINSGIVEYRPNAFMRICNIAVDPDSQYHFDPKILILKCKPYLPTPGGAGAVLFVPPSVYGQIEAAAWEKGNASITIHEVEKFGMLVRIVGIPVRPWDAISENESAVSAAA
jgi:hypothetical protein